MQKRLKEILEDLAEIETRAAKIHADSETAESDQLTAMSAELNDLEARKAALAAEKAELEAKSAEAKGVADGTVEAREIKRKDSKKMTLEEIRKSQKYLDAYAEYLKTGEDKECRAILELRAFDDTVGVGTENATQAEDGVNAKIPVPVYVEERIQTAWENDEIMSRVRRTNFKGNLVVGFERSATEAEIHSEGTPAPSQETLNIGTVKLVPETIKKWITITDEVLDLRGQAFIDYLFDEIEYQIIKKAANLVVKDIDVAANADSNGYTGPAVASIESDDYTPATIFINAAAELSAEARNLVVLLNKRTYALIKSTTLTAYYPVDPFDGMTVLFTDALPALSEDLGSGELYAIVGDLSGYTANFPAGYQPTFKYDDLSLAEYDLIKIVGRLPIGHGVTAPLRFAAIKNGTGIG